MLAMSLNGDSWHSRLLLQYQNNEFILYSLGGYVYASEVYPDWYLLQPCYWVL